MAVETYDVAIIGGGPGGATTGGMLRRWAPELRVGIFERERFPREHVGESQLPVLGAILHELGCWDAVEAADFPIKIGATYRWGRSAKLWDFEFVPQAEYVTEARPRQYGGQSARLAFQVDRAVYDSILLDHASALGCEVHQGRGVRSVQRTGDRVDALILADGTEVQARHYVDASGNSALLRRAMDVPVDVPTKLQNIAFYDYWDNAEWATQFPGGATRVLVLSIGCGWIWYIPLSATRTSIGFICPAAWYKAQDRSPAELYAWALAQEPLIAQLTAKASREGDVRATKDWSFLSSRMAGENWMLVGEAGGFADPILAAGLTLTQTSAREAAYTLLALDRGEHDPAWLRQHYESNQTNRIRQHIRFADFWYSANGIFTDLQDHTRELAKDAGLDLSPQRAFQWLATGGFATDILGQAGIGGLDLAGARQVTLRMGAKPQAWNLSQFNRFRLKLSGASKETLPAYRDGNISAIPCYVRGARRLPEYGYYKILIDALREEHDLTRLLERLRGQRLPDNAQGFLGGDMQQLMQALEIMLNDGWVEGKFDPRRPKVTLGSPVEGRIIHSNDDLQARVEV